MLYDVFTAILSMSITASIAAILIIVFRLMFKNRLPRIFSYALWVIVLVRLLIPFSLTSVLSIFNIIPGAEVIMTQIPQYHGRDNDILYVTGYGSISQEKTANEALSNDVSSSFPAATPEASVDPIQVLTFLASCIWLIGAVGLFSFSMFAYFHTWQRLKTAILYKNNCLVSGCTRKLKLKRKVQIYTSDRIHTPVVCGLVKPHIVLPLALAQNCNESELKHIITHELVHVKRLDYIIKPLSVLALCVHWFNPVIWLGFILSQKDMEMSCDEKVLSVCNNDIRSEYAASLIKLAVNQGVLLNGGLLAFGESNIKSRIKGIMNFKKPGFWLGTTAIIILIAFGIVLLTNGQYREANKNAVIPKVNENQNSNGRFAIYLVKDADTKVAVEKGINNLELEDTPIITEKDIKSYNWSEHSFETSEDVLNRIPSVPVNGIPFVVVVDGERIYIGAFWTSLSSISTQLPVINIMEKPFSINLGYPVEYEHSVDIRNDNRIYNVLKETGKLNFESKIDDTDVDMLLEEIMKNAPLASSNSYDYVSYLKDSKAFAELVAMGKPALDIMMDIFAKSNEDGLKEYIMAAACAKILSIYDEQKGIGTGSGRDWFYKYGTFKKDADFHIVDADYDLFKDTSGKPKLVLPAHTDMKNMEDVITNCILSINRRAYLMGEKAIEAHKIYRTEEKDGIINVYMQVRFHWFGFENGIFTVVSGVSGEPVRMQLKKQENGEYEVLEYRRAMDGGMWEKSIREMFPKDLAEAVINGDETTSKELWDMQVTKAQRYLKEIGREDTQVMSRVIKERMDEKAARAIYLVTSMRNEFPDWCGTREILVNAGGKYPGVKIRCILKTQCEKEKEGQYSILLTKIWDIKINGVQPVSYWKYRITGERVELIEVQDNDNGISIR
ncbi:MAG: hypothetical protein HPY74_13955 [Firmicutes bacterium]|nr:hypothetical protein [Bacillota bacterium]